jgi:L-lactate utilization protein LutB
MLMKFILIVLFVALPFTALAEYHSMDEFAKAYNDESCKVCHPKIYEAWQSSSHRHSVVNSIGIMREYIVTGLEEWKKPLTKEQLMRCMACHAPQLMDASESLIGEVAQFIVAAVDERDEARKAEAKKSLANLNINCIVCHNTRAVLEKNLKGEAKKGIYYGPTGRPSPAHGTEKSADIQSSLFCGQCHKLVTHTDGEIVFCSSLYESYQDAYRSGGGTEACQDCHMKVKDRGHRMPGSHDLNMAKDGILLDVEAAGVKVQPGKWRPTVIVNVGLTNKAGHRTPDG